MTLLHAITIGISCGLSLGGIIIVWHMFAGSAKSYKSNVETNEKLTDLHDRRTTAVENIEDYMCRIAIALERPYLPK